MPEEQAGPGEEIDRPSKSERKRRMTALQELGESLTELNDKQLDQLPLEDPRLLEAIREARAIRSNSARRRHLQYIGRLMRGVDPEPIEQALLALQAPHRQQTADFHSLERLRDEALAAGSRGADLVLERWPQADRQHLRQLILQHEREHKLGRPAAASRKLFRYLRQLQELDSGHP